MVIYNLRLCYFSRLLPWDLKTFSSVFLFWWAKIWKSFRSSYDFPLLIASGLAQCTFLAEPFLNSAREKKDSAEVESSLSIRRSPNLWASQSGFLLSNRYFSLYALIWLINRRSKMGPLYQSKMASKCASFESGLARNCIQAATSACSIKTWLDFCSVFLFSRGV